MFNRIKSIVVYFLLLLFVIGGLLFTQTDTKVQAQSKSKIIPNNYIVVLKDKGRKTHDVANEIKLKHGVSVDKEYSIALKGFSATITQDKLDKVKNDPNVEFVTEDRVVVLDGQTTPTNSPASSTLGCVVSTGSFSNSSFTNQTGSFTATYDGKPSNSPVNSVMGLSNGSASAYANLAVITRFNPSGFIDAMSGGTYQASSSIPYTANQTYHFRVVVNITSHTYSAYVTPPGGAEVLIGSNLNFRTEQAAVTNLNNLSVYSLSPNTDSVCNFSLNGVGGGPTPTNIPTPTSTLTPTPTSAPAPTLTITPTPTSTLTPTPTSAPTPTLTIAPTPNPLIPNGISRIQAQANQNKGTGIGVAVIDSGIDLTHPDLKDNIVGGHSCIQGNSTGDDDNGHGTHVAGTIAAENNSYGVVGVAPKAKLVAVKVMNSSGAGTWSSIICGIDWVTANRYKYNIKVANMSIVGGGTSDNNCGNTNNDALHKAICNSTKAGITYVVAAGNSGSDISTWAPAEYNDTVITVSALADSDGKSGGLGINTPYSPDDTFPSWNNYGSVVDLGAPGVDIYSTWLNGGYNTLSGTSMATPHVAGSAALYIKSHPGSTWSQVRAGLIAKAEPLNAGHTDPSGLHPEPIVKANAL